MTTDPSVSDQTQQYFVQEATELLQTMDDELQNIREDFSVQKVHNLMRAAHTLKGASASVGLDAVKKTTHSLEDVFKALCHQDTVISVEMEGLIFQGYDCLKLLMSAQLAGAKIEEADILDRMATVVTRLQAMLGDRFGQGGHLPTSSELGFDMTQSIFEVGVAQRIETLEDALEAPDLEELTELLETQAEIFIGLAESLDLPGFGEIATTTLAALQNSPDQVLAIATVAFANYKEGHAAVLAGDRTQGGTPSAALQQFCGNHHKKKSNHTPTNTAQKEAGQKTGTLPHSHNSASKPTGSWLGAIWKFFTRPIGDAKSGTEKQGHRSTHTLATSLISNQSSASTETTVNTTFLAPETFIDYSAEGDEPADLALADLTPTDLSSIDLPRAQAADQRKTQTQASLQNETDEAVELAELTPTALNDLALSSLDNISEQALEPLPDLSTLLGNSSGVDDPSVAAAQALATKSKGESTSAAAPLKPETNASVPGRVPVRSQNRATIRMTVEDLDQLSQSMGELLTHQNRQALYNEQLSNLTKKLLTRIARQQKQLNQYRSHNTLSNKPQAERPLNTSIANQASNLSFAHFDSLELDQYSDVQLLAQSFLEETVQQSESAEAIELFVTRSGQELEKQKRLLSNTRETLLGARMLPLDKIFQRFPSALERLEAQHGKQVELILKGSEVLIDKVIADKLYDPLLHLVRNAFDHGIETPDRRQRQNKSATGHITIEAVQQGRHLIINVKDDGQGLDLDMIRRKAVENNVVTNEEAAALSSEQTIELLFEAGFSTASEVDDLSGRGVGLDAVRAQVRSLKGWVAVTHEPDLGTCFSLQIPSSLTIAKLLLCQAQGRIYALIADAIEHILIPAESQVRAWDGGKTLTWQTDGGEHLLPVNALAEVLHYASPMPSHRLPETRNDIKAAADPVIVLKHQSALVGIEVDQLLGEQELVISSLGETLVPPPYLYGSSILPDGQLTLVLDGVMLSKIVLEQRSQQGSINIKLDEELALTPNKPSTNEAIFLKKLVLTVDDSITVRNTLAEALQKADYQVIQARDGAEALEQLKRYPNVEAILCDIEMPGMNGFEFLKVRQQTPQIAAIPTIMLTSRGGSKHRMLTKELGATAYLTKPYLSPQLLKTVADAIKGQTTLDKNQLLSLAGEPS
ncbi:MAG: hybrid sensor histidine kinase/response regulator [Cyanobacteria bacterium J06634_5]